MQPALKSYLRTQRLRWGFTQAELAFLLGAKSGSVVSRIERYKRRPAMNVVLACQIVFNSSTLQVFPAIYSEIEEAVLRRAYQLHEQLQGNPSKTTKAKLDLLEDVLRRAVARVETV